MVIKNTKSILSITISLMIMLLAYSVICTVASCSYAGTKRLPQKSFTQFVGIAGGGWISIRTNLSGDLTYSDSKSNRTFTKEDYFMYATSANDPVLTKQANVDMGILVLHAGGKTYKCYQASGKYPYYADPTWLAHKRTVSKTKAVGKLKGKSYATLGFSIAGHAVATPRSGTASWYNIAK